MKVSPEFFKQLGYASIAGGVVFIALAWVAERY